MVDDDPASVTRALRQIASYVVEPRGLPLSERLASADIAHVVLRATGSKVAARWLDGPVPDLLAQTVSDAVAERTRRGQEPLTTVEITLPRDWSPLPLGDLSRGRCNEFRGIFGLEVRCAGNVARMGPLELIARNLSPDRCLDLLREQLGNSPTAKVYRFSADQYLIDLRAERCVPLFRGQPVVAQDEINRESVAEMAGAMTTWLMRQVAADGKTTYKYWPSSGRYSEANNMIRQFMASACLASASARLGADAHLAQAVERNFWFNFGTFYRAEGTFGFIDEFGKVKLGAAAVAVLAILNLPDPAPWSDHLDRLRAFIESMQDTDGSFRTFLRPLGRNDCQNFYPGEAALALARLHARHSEAVLLDRLRACFAFYRGWHRANRNPAFVPWHTQAYCMLHDFTGDTEVADFVFEMNDWLLGVQEVTECAPDVVGDFFDPSRPFFGPPHASSTGVYLEGLVDAWDLAKRHGHHGRAEAYRQAMVRGLRSLRQLQFRSDDDMFYIRRKSRVRGGVRSSAFDNTLRIDNVQHGLMAILAIQDRFSESDYRL